MDLNVIIIKAVLYLIEVYREWVIRYSEAVGFNISEVVILIDAIRGQSEFLCSAGAGVGREHVRNPRVARAHVPHMRTE